MKVKVLGIIIIFLSVLFNTKLFAQDKMIHGIVTTFDSIPLTNAKVEVESSKRVVLTDSLGMFSVPCNNKDKLKVSANGFYSQNASINEKTGFAAINLKMKFGDNMQYDIGYDVRISEDEKLNALARLSDQDLDFSLYSNLLDLIKGRFAGVQVINNQIIIRGANSINTSNTALIVVDGVQYNDQSILKIIPPKDVKSINIIKDSGAAIYGTKSANGVIVIERKKANNL